MAEVEGDEDKLRQKLEELEQLEERATELDRRRTSNINSISYINQRNRLRNIIDAENACKAEVAEAKNAKADPFTRRACRPTLVTKVTYIYHYRSHTFLFLETLISFFICTEV